MAKRRKVERVDPVRGQRAQLLEAYLRASATFDERFVRTTSASDLPPDWRESLPSPRSQSVGDEWVALRASAVLRVPSVLIEAEWNYLLNPNHPDFPRIEIGRESPFAFPERLAKRS